MDETDRQRGWTTIPHLLTRSECQRILDACDEIIADPADRHHRDKPASGTKHLEGLDERVPLVAELLALPSLGDAVADWFQLDTAPRPQKVSLRAPGPGYGGQDLHRDAPEGPPLPSPVAVTAIIALARFDETNGATRFVPGSHLTGEPASKFRGRGHSPDEILFTGAAGTAFVFDGHALHAGGQNNSDRDRPALQIAWNLGSQMLGGY